ncbi:hypothetical protein ABKV19_004235, partial [Rosa sericea]
APTLELKPLPGHLKYVYLGDKETLPVIISSSLTPTQEERLVEMLKKHKTAIGWTLADIRGISPTTCVHRILLEDGAKPTREAQRRLNPPMMEVVKKEEVAFEFDEDCKKAFNTLKELLTSAPIMLPPDWSLPFEIMCDASDYAIGAVLGQRKDKKPYAIYYASRTLNDAQLNYSTTEKELLAVVFALEKFRSYLLGTKVIIYSDHAALRCQRTGNLGPRDQMPLTPIIIIEIFD